jgi:Ca2+:H+ antiporter
MNWLQLFIPVSIALEHFTPNRHLLVFPASALTILPLLG